MRNKELQEFYIGWMEKAPVTFSKHIKKVLLLLVVVVFAAAILLAVSQKKFSSANFEFGTLTEVKGVYYEQPVPCIKVVNGKDIFGTSSYITIPLLGFGKMGAAGVISAAKKEKNTSFNQREMTLKGTLLYNDGKLLMQVDTNDKPLTAVSDNKKDTLLFEQPKEIGMLDIKGEIVDPKCFFGVMKPGEGKPHKDCAIRCILGGIPPVLKVTNDEGKQNYYLIVGAHGEKMNEAVQDYVASQVTIHAKAVEYGDWIVLYVPRNGLQYYSYIGEHYKNDIAMCGNSSMK